MTGETRCDCGHFITALNGLQLVYGHDPRTGECTRCECERGDVVPLEGEPIVFGVHRIRAVDADTAPAWDPSPPTLAERRAAIDRVLRHREA